MIVSTMNEESKILTPISNFDLEKAVTTLPIKHLRGVNMKDQLPAQPKVPESGINNLDDHDGPGTHWTCYGISPSNIIYFDSYGLPTLRGFIKYVKEFKIPIWYSTIATQTLTDPLICGQEVLNILKAISTSPKLPHKAVNEYTIINHLKKNM